MGWWFSVLLVAMALAAAYFGWNWFARYFREGVDDPQNADVAAIMLLGGGALLVVLVAGVAFELLSRMGWL